jgi:penicillin-binding protein 2
MTDALRTRILVVGVVTLALFSALFARLWYLQVIESEQYEVAAEGNRVRIVPREAPRGRILDRRGRVLVENRVDNVVAVSRSLVGDERGEVLSKLSTLLKVPVAKLEERLEDRRFADFRPVPVATDADEAAMVAVRERQEEFPGVEARQVPVRRYRYGSLAAHVLGYVGEINDQELADRRQEGYRLGDKIGKVGVERAYEVDLRGVPGFESYEVDRRGNVLRLLGEREPQRGHDVQLSLDLDVQRAAERSLARRIELAREGGSEAGGGAVVALDARDGSVVALASYPTFDPTGFIHGITTEVWEQLNDPASFLPLNNRPVQGVYAPASTFKIVTSLSGLTTGQRDIDSTIEDEGRIEIGDRFFRNAGSKAYGRVDLRRAITVSSDVYFYKLGFDINGLDSQRREEIQRVARSFGFGEPTGVELPFEQDGRVPDREWKAAVHEANPEAFPEGRWFAGDNVNLAIGQGDLLVTPLQLTNAFAAVANGGTIYRPHVGARVVDRFGSVVREVEGEVEGEVEALTPERRAALIDGMIGTVTHREGTAYEAFKGWSGPLIAGKTGTAQVRRKADTSLFVGVYPATSPRYVVGAVIEEAGAGAELAAPVVRDILANILRTEQDRSLPPIGTLFSPGGLPLCAPTTDEDPSDALAPEALTADGASSTTTLPVSTTTTLPEYCAAPTTTTTGGVPTTTTTTGRVPTTTTTTGRVPTTPGARQGDG